MRAITAPVDFDPRTVVFGNDPGQGKPLPKGPERLGETGAVDRGLQLDRSWDSAV